LIAAGGQLLADVKFDFPEGAFGDYPGIGPIPAGDTTVVSPAGLVGLVEFSLTQPLTQLHEVGLQVDAGDKAAESDREALRDARLSAAEEVKRAYAAILRTQSAQDATAEALGYLKEVERVATSQVAAEAALTADLLDVRARLAETEHQDLILRH